MSSVPFCSLLRDYTSHNFSALIFYPTVIPSVRSVPKSLSLYCQFHPIPSHLSLSTPPSFTVLYVLSINLPSVHCRSISVPSPHIHPAPFPILPRPVYNPPVHSPPSRSVTTPARSVTSSVPLHPSTLPGSRTESRTRGKIYTPSRFLILK